MSLSDQKVVLTGATGFIGAAIVLELERGGAQVTAVVRPTSNRQRLAGLTGCRAHVVERLDDPDLIGALRAWKPSHFIHCAWRGTGGRERNEPFQITENLPLTLAAAQLAANTGCGHWLGLGSQAEYGNLNRAIDEAAPTNPTTVYGKAKLAAGIAALALCEACGIPAAWVRVFSTYGPNDAPHWLVPYLIREFAAGRPPQLTKCEQLWDYLHVDDAARAIVEVAERRLSGVFNLGSGEAVPLRQVVERVRALLAPEVHPHFGAIAYRPDQVMHLQANIGKLQAATGWRPVVSLPDGLSECVKFSLKNRPSA